MRSEVIVQANGVPICAQAFGERGDPAVLLIMGAAGSMDWWPAEFCELLAASGRFVIRYDHRDTGRSVSYPPGKPGYTGGDLLDDVVGLLDALGIDRAHIVGISMGGALAQAVALNRPESVTTLTLISTSAADRETDDLPWMSEETAAAFAAIPEPDWTGRAAVIDYVVAQQRVAASPHAPFDADEIREIAGRMFDRTENIASALTNHSLLESGDPPARKLEELEMPVLVVHGRDDPVIPVEHSHALVEGIPSAQLLLLNEVGHEFPRRAWERVAPAIVEHTS